MILQKTNKKEILIVGQGIAGTLLAFFLLQKNQAFKVIDISLPGASSSVAAGIINPITGRRMVKSWRFDELSDFARRTYNEIGQFLGIPVFQEKNILRALPNVFEENEWERRSGFPENQPYFSKTADLGNYQTAVKPAHAWGKIAGAAKVDMQLLVSSFRQYLLNENLLIEEVFDFEHLKVQSTEVSYRGAEYAKLIFCEGAKAVHNPYFDFLSFVPSKGEAFIIKVKGLKVEDLLKNKIYLVPLKNEIFWVGSTNSFDYQEVVPSKEMHENLNQALEEALSVPFEILAHNAGIRPTVKDKRPILGLHPKHSSLGIFNGLGTKGASIGPLFAKQMAAFLVDDTPPDDEVDIKRFEND